MTDEETNQTSDNITVEEEKPGESAKAYVRSPSGKWGCVVFCPTVAQARRTAGEALIQYETRKKANG